MTRPKSEPVPISVLVEQLLARMPQGEALRNRVRRQRLVSALGEWASDCQGVREERGELVFWLSSPALVRQLRLQEPQVRARLREMGVELPVRFRVGQIGAGRALSQLEGPAS